MTETVAAVYEAALAHGTVQREELPRLSGLSATEADDALETLTALQLLRHSPEQPGLFTAADPLSTELLVLDPLESELRARRARLHRLRSWLDLMRPVHTEATTRRGNSDALTPLSTSSEITEALESAADSCVREVLTIQPGGPRREEVLRSALPRDTAMLSRGIRMRTLYQHSARFSGPTQSYVERVRAVGGEVRTALELTRRLLIFDRDTAFIPDAEDDSMAFLIRQPSIMAYLVDVFEKEWDRALPFTSAAESRTDAVLTSAMTMSVARLMLVERKDSAIARRLGISERTCRSHIAKIMNQVGARNRTHLGYLLSTGGLQTLDSATAKEPGTAGTPSGDDRPAPPPRQHARA
ncbi:LuxR C-terminal-related transcriptional regulator [Streptomyces qinglanensis]|uniref:helix-turn-helix transcriptional regulator n=1 Tax=Streptomyces qinglanensis TaxID=943816 RepID=UPI003D760301